MIKHAGWGFLVLVLSVSVPANAAGTIVHIDVQPGITIEGSLRTPDGNGPFPLLVCFAGTGPNARGGFKLLKDRVQAKGIATFGFDKRGVGQSTGTFDDTITTVAADAAAVVRALKQRPEIDKQRIALCGLSQGGVIGPLVAAEDSDIAAVVMFSGPVGKKADMFLMEMRTRLRAGGKSAKAAGQACDAIREWMDARLAQAPADRIAGLRANAVQAFAVEGTTAAQAEGMVAILDTPMLLSMYAVDPAKALRQLKVPVLALYGAQDNVIDVPARMANAKTALRDNPDATVLAIPNANHLMQKDGKGYPVGIPSVLDLVTDWLVKRLHPTPPA